MESNSGIVNNKIPSSVRKDGTIRKEIKVRPGFVPQQDVSSFKSKKLEKLENFVPGTTRQRNDPKKEERARKAKKPALNPVVASKPVIDTPNVQKDPLKQQRAIEKKLRQIKELELKDIKSTEELEKIAKKRDLEQLLQELRINP